jgi:hypothetical protein
VCLCGCTSTHTALLDLLPSVTQIILLQIVLTIFEDSSLVGDLLLIDYSAEMSCESRRALTGSSESEENEAKLCRKSVTEDFLVNVAGLIDILYQRKCHVSPEGRHEDRDDDKHNNSGSEDSITKKSAGSRSSNGNSRIDPSSVTSSGSGLRDRDSSEMLLLCLNVLGAGVSYPPRDLGSVLRGRIGGESKVLDTCCKILMNNEKRKTDFIAQKVKDRDSKRERLARTQAEETATATATSSGNRISEGRLCAADSDSVENKKDIDSSSGGGSSSSSNGPGYDGERERPLTEEEQVEGELVKAALQVIGNLAYGCASVQVLSGCTYRSFIFFFT